MRQFFKAVLVGALFSSTLALPALAENGKTERTIVVHIGDLDLSGPTGQATLHARLTEAARDACRRPGDSTRVIGTRAERKACITAALETAYASLPRSRPYAQLGQ
jgi:UrcA family protein